MIFTQTVDIFFLLSGFFCEICSDEAQLHLNFPACGGEGLIFASSQKVQPVDTPIYLYAQSVSDSSDEAQLHLNFPACGGEGLIFASSQKVQPVDTPIYLYAQSVSDSSDEAQLHQSLPACGGEGLMFVFSQFLSLFKFPLDIFNFYQKTFSRVTGGNQAGLRVGIINACYNQKLCFYYTRIYIFI